VRTFGRLVLSLLIVTAAGIGAAAADPFRVNSGKSLDILSIQVEKTAQGRALVLRFGTRTPLSDIPGLRMEADELWEHFVVNVEKGDYRRAVIRAAALAKGGKTVDFVYLKRGGDWRTLVKELGPGGRLTEALLRRLYDRYRTADQKRGRRITELYTAPDWTVSYSYPPESGIGTLELDRETFLGLLDRIRSQGVISGRDYAMEVTRIRVAPDGRSATVQAGIKGRVTIRGRRVAMRGRLVERLAVERGAIVSTQMRLIFEEIFDAIDH